MGCAKQQSLKIFPNDGALESVKVQRRRYRVIRALTDTPRHAGDGKENSRFARLPPIAPNHVSILAHSAEENVDKFPAATRKAYFR